MSDRPDILDITGLSKAAVLATLYNRARTKGSNCAEYDPSLMTEAEAERVLRAQHSLVFDYLRSRPLKINLEGDVVDAAKYNEYNGCHEAQFAIEGLRDGTDDRSSPHPVRFRWIMIRDRIG